MFKQGIEKGFSKFLTDKGALEWRACEVLDFFEDDKKFLIRWRHDGTTKKVTRLNLMFAIEREDEFERRLENALENRYKNLYLQSYERISLAFP